MLPALNDFEPTRRTLHLYCRAVDVIPRAHGIAHPRWEHVSLRVTPRGLQTASVPIPGGGVLSLVMDLRTHSILLETSLGDQRSFSLTDQLSSAELGERLIGAAAECGLHGGYQRERFEDHGERLYDPGQAEAFFGALVEVDRIFKIRRAELGGWTSPVQFWTHGFDLSLEWFGTRRVKSGGGNQPAQLNLGFFPGGPGTDPYFYSNPWPFDADQLTDHSLPPGASWHQDDWEGTIFPYRELVGSPRVEDRLLEYARAVYEIAAPTLS